MNMYICSANDIISINISLVGKAAGESYASDTLASRGSSYRRSRASLIRF